MLEVSTNSPSLPAHSIVVMVVDDNQAVADALAKVIRAAGFSAIAFYNGAAALTHLESNPVGAAVIDVHLSDISGLVLASRLRAQLGPAAPIVILSGDTSMETINRLAQVGATYFFSKPVKSSELVARLRVWLKFDLPVDDSAP